MARTKTPTGGDYDTKDTSRRCSDDERLRKHGFRIKSRPSGKPAIWEKQNQDGEHWVEYTEEIAHRYCDRQEQLAAGEEK